MTIRFAPWIRLRAGDGLALSAAVLGPLALYVMTLPRTVVLEDDGLFLMAASHLGIAHPPGYPLYTLVCHLFMQLPFRSPAFLGHLSSAVLGAAACGFVYLCARLLQASRLSALTAALLFGASEHFWSQAIIAEVYALNALLFFATYALLLHGVRHPQRAWIWLVAAAAYGLSLANHWPLMVLAFPGLLVAVFPVWRAVLPKVPLLLGVSLLSAALPYAWMVWRSQQNPLISFYGPIESWEAFWYYFSREGYAGVDVKPSAGWDDRFAFLHWFGNEVLWQLTLPGFLLAVVGLVILFRRRQVAVAASGLLVFLGNSLLLIVLLGFDFEALQTAVFRPYSLVCFGLAAVWLALGLQFLLDRLSDWRPGAGKSWFETAATLAGLGMIAFSVQAHWPLNDWSDNDFTRRYADMIFSLLPQDAVLLVSEDLDTGPLGYYRFVENRRPDVTLVNTQGLVFQNRLYSPKLANRRKEEILRAFVDETERPVFSTGNDFLTQYRIRHYGFVEEILTGDEPGSMELTLNPTEAGYFEELVQYSPNGEWENLVRSKLLHQYGGYLGYATLSEYPALLQRTGHLLALAEGSFFGLTGMVEVLMEKGNRTHWQRVEELLEKAQRIRPDTLSQERLARFLYLQGMQRFRSGDPRGAIAFFEESRAVYSHPENASIGALEQLGISSRQAPPR